MEALIKQQQAEIERLRSTAWGDVRRKIEEALAAGLGPEDIGPAGLKLYAQLAAESGGVVPQHEIYSAFMSPERWGVGT